VNVDFTHSTPPPLAVRDLVHAYGDRRALNGVSFQVQKGEMFALLGPNGSGKTTLFRIVATLVRPRSGEAAVFGARVDEQPAAVRSRMGIVFQSAALDAHLTIVENLRHHARLYGLSGRRRRRRVDAVLAAFGLEDRASHRVGTLSGGLKRRADLARGLLHEPQLLILDEPSSGLDPGARRDFWTHLEKLRRRLEMTILVTTHLMDEAERCNRVGILDHGRLVGLDTPAVLRREIGGTVVTVQAERPEELSREVAERFQVSVTVVDGALHIEHSDGHGLVPRLASAFSARIASITVQTPTLEDVFVHRTGHGFEDEPSAGGEA
jgi:ABC-2 type transport system ATP-binding protein